MAVYKSVLGVHSPLTMHFDRVSSDSSINYTSVKKILELVKVIGFPGIECDDDNQVVRFYYTPCTLVDLARRLGILQELGLVSSTVMVDDTDKVSDSHEGVYFKVNQNEYIQTLKSADEFMASVKRSREELVKTFEKWLSEGSFKDIDLEKKNQLRNGFIDFMISSNDGPESPQEAKTIIEDVFKENKIDDVSAKTGQNARDLIIKLILAISSFEAGVCASGPDEALTSEFRRSFLNNTEEFYQKLLICRDFLSRGKEELQELSSKCGIIKEEMLAIVLPGFNEELFRLQGKISILEFQNIITEIECQASEKALREFDVKGLDPRRKLPLRAECIKETNRELGAIVMKRAELIEEKKKEADALRESVPTKEYPLDGVYSIRGSFEEILAYFMSKHECLNDFFLNLLTKECNQLITFYEKINRQSLHEAEWKKNDFKEGQITKEMLEQLFQTAPGLLLGSAHIEEHNNRFLLQNMQALAESGVKVIYMEGFANDFIQSEIDEFFAGPREKMSEFLENYLEELDRKYDYQDYQMKDVFYRARDAGIKVVGIESQMTTESDRDNRLLLFNYIASEIIKADQAKESSGGKFVVCAGFDHVIDKSDR